MRIEKAKALDGVSFKRSCKVSVLMHLNGESIRFGLAAVKNVGEGAIESILKMREKDGKFKSIYDFTGQVDPRLVNRKVIESLIKCGALDSLKLFRSQLSAMVDKALEVAGDVQPDASPIFSFFPIQEIRII